MLCLAVAPQPGFSASKNNPLLGGRSPGTGGGGGGTSPGGSNGQIQFNNAGAFDGLSNVPVSQGGTGANTAAGARSGLGLAPIESLVVNDSARDTKYQPVDSGFGPATAMSRTFGEKFTDEYHVRDWASASASPIKCDTVEVYDVSSTNGTATFTSAGAYTYNAAHVGRTAYVVSYDNNHTPKLTASGTILSGSGNTVTLSGNANRTSTSQYMVIYGNDDTAGLNDLIAAAGKKGGTLVLPNGTCSVSASLTISSRIMFGGQSIRQSAIIARPNMTGAIIKSKNYDALAGQTGTNYGDNPLTQAFYGLRNLRIDGASFAQASPNKCVQMHGNAKYIDSVEILNCSDPLETEAAFTYAYSATDPMSREEDYINNLFIRNFTGKGWLNRGGHDTQGGHILIYNSLASTDWGYRQECSGGTYGGNGFFESLHVYPGPNAIYIGCGATRFGTLYTDLGRTEVTGGNVKVGMLKILGCGYGGVDSCLKVSGDSFEANVEFGWYSEVAADISNVVGVDVTDAAENWKINMSDAGVLNPDAGAIVFRNRGNYGQLTGNIKGATGTGGVCVDMGGAMGDHRFSTQSCTTHMAYQAAPESFRNIIHWASFAQGGETLMTGAPQASDIFCNTESGAVNGAFRGCVTGRHNLRADNASIMTLRPSASTTAYDFFFPPAPGTAGSPMISGGTGADHAYGTRTGNTTVFATSTGTRTSGNFASWDANGNAIDSGVAVGGGGGGSGTVNSGTSGQIAYYAANGTAVSGQSTVPMTAGGNAASNATQGTANLLRDSTQHARWSAALNAFKSGTAGLTVAMIGDSLIDSVSGGTRLTSISNQLRNGLTHQGLMVNDNAWVGCGDDGNGGVRRDIADVRVVKGSSWGCDNTFLTMGGGTWFSTTNTNALAFSPDMQVDGALVYFVIQPSGGSFTIDFNGFGTQTINTATTTSGGGVQVVGLVGGNAIGVLTYSGGQGSNTTYNLKWSAGGRVDIIGIVATNSSGAAATLINAGVGGSVSAAAVNTTNPWSYLNVMTAIAPGLVVFDYAANDATLAVPTATYQSNLGTLLTAIQGWNGDAIAMTPPPKNPGSGQSYVFQETYNAIMRTQAATFGIPVADVFNLYESNYTKYQAAPYSLYSDTFVHQSAKGNATIADLLTRIMLSRSDMSKQMKRSVFQEVDSWGNYKLGGNIVIPKNVNGATSSTYFGVSGNANATGAYNAIIGYQAGNVLTTGFNHTAVGYQALLAMNTAQNNTAIGYQALKASTANDNTALGVLACGTVSTGTNNLCLGRGVGSTTLTTGGSNILIGTSSAITTPAAGTNNWLSIGDAIAGSMAAPALSACGTGPALATGGSDLRGTVTTGTGATACTITFATTKANAPTCIVTARSGTPPVYTTSTAALTLTTAAASAGYDYFCSGK